MQADMYATMDHTESSLIEMIVKKEDIFNDRFDKMQLFIEDSQKKAEIIASQRAQESKMASNSIIQSLNKLLGVVPETQDTNEPSVSAVEQKDSHHGVNT